MSALTAPVVLIVGAGANIGSHVARTFAAKGYRVALSSRSTHSDDSTSGFLSIRGDLSDPNSVGDVFAKVRDTLGHPSVVIYNAGASTFNNAKDPLSLSVADFNRDFTINTTSVLAAAHQAVRGFQTLPDTASRTFIYTGNCLNVSPMAPALSLGMGKSATAHLIANASQAYHDQGFKFYYADERKADGRPAGAAIDGQAHADLYLRLAEGNTQGPWLQTFVKGSGYVDFTAKM